MGNRARGALPWVILLGCLTMAFSVSAAQQSGTVLAQDSVTVAAGKEYSAGWLHRKLFGGHYRDLWMTPITVPVLDLRRFGGGLKAEKIGGGMQTRSLRLSAPNGREYVFRPIRKDSIAIESKYRNTVVESVLKDAIASAHPVGMILADPLLTAAGVLHPRPYLVMMPDDPALGEFRSEFGNRMGTIEEFPKEHDEGTGFGRAAEIIDSEDLLERLNKDPSQPVDARAYLRARLVDMLINDWDRHPGQWKWARGGAQGDEWQPVSRDRDRAFVSYSGILPKMASMMVSNATPFRGEPPRVKGLTYNSLGMDRRLLVTLDRPAWDSIANDLVKRISNEIIDSAFARQPVEYKAQDQKLVDQLRIRRDGLPQTAADFYRAVNQVAEIHATDAPEDALVQVSDSSVQVELRARSRPRPYLVRHFSIPDSREIRIYLHGGDDRAVIRGNAQHSIPIRVIGGEGNNLLIDSSSVAGRPAGRLYDNGTIEKIEYGPDSLFDRRPWITKFGKKTAPGQDYGAKLAPVMAITFDRDLGAVPTVGISQTTYGFRHIPYARRLSLEVTHATKVGHGRARATLDQRLEDSRLHWTIALGMSDLEVVRFHGFGNNTTGGTGDFFNVNQRQWTAEPAIGLRVGTRNEITFGPVIKYSETHGTANSFLGTDRPYGIGDFGQVGAVIRFQVDERDHPEFATRGLRAEVEARVYPALWDVQGTFGSLRAVAMSYFMIPVPTEPVLAMRVGGKRVFGDFPFHEAAFLGGGSTVRNLNYQRYAGDTEVDVTLELRFRLANIRFILPLDVGVFPLWETGRVWLDGESPEGWHSAYGGGVWIGLPDPSKSISISVTDGDLNRLFLKAGLTF